MAWALNASMHTPHPSVPKLARLHWNVDTPEGFRWSTGKTRTRTPIISSHLVLFIPSRRHLLGVDKFDADMALTTSNLY